VHAGDARNQFRVSGAGLAVAVLDTGINPRHVDFAGRIVAEQNFTSDNGGDVGDATDGNYFAFTLCTSCTFDVEEETLLEMKSTQLEKQAIAWLLKTQTVVTGVRIAARLGMGHRVNALRNRHSGLTPLIFTSNFTANLSAAWSN
jgi:subtilisin family serine protease